MEIKRDVENLERTAAVKEHVKKNRVKTNKNRRKCVDGGYKKEEAPGAVARAGGDLGYSEALLLIKKLRPELGLTVQESFDFVNDFVKSKNQKYGWHSDSHSAPAKEGSDHGHEVPVIGCGHCLRALSNAEYGVSPEEVKELVRIVSNAEDTDFVNLDRSHNEKAVLVITSAEYTVNHWDTEQFFVYNAVNDAEFLSEFILFLNEKLGNRGSITIEELKSALDTQLDITLRLLAGELPVYRVNPDDEHEPEVIFDHIVPKYAKAA